MENMKAVYEIEWLIERVYKESDKLIGKIADTSKFEERCIKDLAQYLGRAEENKKHRRHLIRMINRHVGQALEIYKTNDSVPFSVLSRKEADNEEKEIEFEPIDVLANVESETIAKEMTALLAQDDHRKKIILGNWITGNDNVSDIARLLAQTIGGSVETHRKYIHRFQKECRKFIAA